MNELSTSSENGWLRPAGPASLPPALSQTYPTPKPHVEVTSFPGGSATCLLQVGIFYSLGSSNKPCLLLVYVEGDTTPKSTPSLTCLVVLVATRKMEMLTQMNIRPLQRPTGRTTRAPTPARPWCMGDKSCVATSTKSKCPR